MNIDEIARLNENDLCNTNKTDCRGMSVDEIIELHGYDWSMLSLDDVDFSYQDLSRIILPNDTELFQKITDKSLYETKLPKGDYSQHNFDDVDIQCSEFTSDSIFSEDTDVFQKIFSKIVGNTELPKGDYSKYNFDGVYLDGCRFTPDSIFSLDTKVFQKISGESVEDVALPKGNYSEYDFQGVYLRGCEFTQDSIFSTDKDVFQKICAKDLSYCCLPKGDYSSYNFAGVHFGCTVFTKDSILPEYENFLNDIEIDSDWDMPDNIIKNIHNYNLDEVFLNLNDKTYSEVLTQRQIDIIKTKYPDAIGKTIILPSEVFGDNSTEEYDF